MASVYLSAFFDEQVKWVETPHGARASDSRVSRRHVLRGAAALSLTGVLGAIAGTSWRASAEPLNGAVPTVDGLAVRIVTDNYQFAVAPSRKIGSLEVQHFGWGIRSGQPPGPTLVSEFGLSMHAESRRAGETRQILVDFGFTSNALANNLRLLEIDPGQLDALVLSHGHFDHFGGLPAIVDDNRLRSGTPLIVGGEDCFCAREWTAGPVRGDFGVIDRPALERVKLVVLIAEQPSLVAGHAFTTGQIATRSFEKLLSPSAMILGVKAGAGCYPDRLPEAVRQQTSVPDQFQHELATVYNLKDRGLVILTSCSHRGVVNAIKQAQAVSGVVKVHAVVGGFHLAPYQPDYLAETIAALREVDPDYVIPLHCSGEPFYELAKAELGSKLVRSYTGTRLVFA
jgi:7,8-dihydropterin-6-yl-methyl-4-(beta-D-ribofuranosyl)aminobenzene 5'-phosphate synthase